MDSIQDSKIDNLPSAGSEMLRGRLVSEGYTCLGIDIQAPRFTPRGKGVRIEFSPNYHPSVTLCLFGDFFDLLHPVHIGSGHIEGVLKNSKRFDIDLLSCVPDNSPNFHHDDTSPDTLRKEVKKLMIDLDLDLGKRGVLGTFATELSSRLSKKISRQTLSMALCGYRCTAAYQTILEALRAMLSERLIMPM